MYERGMQYYQNGEYDKAREWLEVAAKNGNGYAWLYIGNMYDKGLGVEKDGNYSSLYLERARKILGDGVNYPNG